jgi:hypothetical protein
VALNQTLFLAEKILQVLGDSNQTLESRLAASEIVVKLLKAEPYGSLALLNSEEYSEAANPFLHMDSKSQSRSDQSPCTEGTSQEAGQP